jgi:hypothetical protein
MRGIDSCKTFVGSIFIQQQGSFELFSNKSWCLAPVIDINGSKGNWTRSIQRRETGCLYVLS